MNPAMSAKRTDASGNRSAIGLLSYALNLEPLKAALDSASDAAEAEELLEREAHLLYVACSRARDRLLLTSGGQLTRFLAEK